MNTCHSHIADGMSQSRRLPDILRPENVKVDGRSLEDLLLFIYQIADQFRYFDANNQVKGSWKQFFTKEQEPEKIRDEIRALLNGSSAHRKHPAHLALLISCLKLYQIYQKDLNQFTKKHLDYFYKEHLGQKLGKAEKDYAHLILQLSTATSNYALETGTRFLAKDATGKPHVFEAVRNTPLNKARISDLKNLYLDSKGRFWLNELLENNQTNLADVTKAVPWSMFKGRRAEAAVSSQRSPGFAISMPDLYLTSGDTTISLNIRFEKPKNTALSKGMTQMVEYVYSTKEGWSQARNAHLTIKEVPDSHQKLDDNNPPEYLMLSMEMPVSATEFPVLPADSEIFGHFQSPWPVIKILPDPASQGYDYLNFQKIKPLSFELVVNVTGYDQFLLQNDQFIKKGDKPFPLFTHRPGIGSNAYIGSNEVFNKQLETLKLSWDWYDKPDLETHYSAYDETEKLDKSYFLVNVSLLANGKWHTASHTVEDASEQVEEGIELSNGEEQPPTEHSELIDLQLFENRISLKFNTESGTHELTQNEDSSENEDPYELDWDFIPQANNKLTDTNAWNNQTPNGFMRLQLTDPVEPIRAFGHADFARVFAQKAILTPTDLPNLPYTPQITHVKADYTARRKFSLTENTGAFRFFHIYPFDTAAKLKLDSETRLFPLYEPLSYFFIGMSNLNPGQTISLLFKADEGSAEVNSTAELPGPDAFTWSYLAGEKWKTVPPRHIQVDKTQYFSKSGIIQILIPEDASLSATRMPAGQIWLRIAFDGDPEKVSDLIAIHPQAVAVSRVMEKEASDEDFALLEAGSVHALLESRTAIKGINQPYSTFGGRSQEIEANFYARVAERFRHKDRAISPWDYERLVLAYFPEIYKAKCIPHTAGDGTQASRSLNMIVIPAPEISSGQGLPNSRQLQPRADAITLDEIKNRLAVRTAPGVEVSVGNPLYEEVLMDFSVQFLPGFDTGLYTDRLNTDILRFLSPWAFSEGEEIIIGGKFLKSDIIRFIESRPYVDFVQEVDMYHLVSNQSECPGLGNMEIVGKDSLEYAPFTVKHQSGPGIGEMYIEPPVNAEAASRFLKLSPEERSLAQKMGLYHPGVVKSFTVGQSLEQVYASTTRSVLVSAPRHRIHTVPPTTGSLCTPVISSGLGVMRIEIDFEVSERV